MLMEHQPIIVEMDWDVLLLISMQRKELGISF